MSFNPIKTLISVGMAALALLGGPAAHAAPVITPNVTAELVSSRDAVAPGETATIALRMDVREGWHTYWRNAGDSGSAPILDWTAPPGVDVGDLTYPLPKIYTVGPADNLIATYVHEGETLYPISVKVPASAKPGDAIDLVAEAEWQVCSDICIIENGRLTISLPVAAKGADNPMWAEEVRNAIAAVPVKAGIEARLTASPGGAALTATGGPLAGAELRDAYFFPFSSIVISHSAPQRPEVGPQGVKLALVAGTAGELGGAAVPGVLSVEMKERGQWVRRGFEIEAQPGEPLAGAGGAALSSTVKAAAPSGGGDELTFWPALLLAFLGGLILNVMPCVLPVLSIKALSFVGGAHAGEARQHGLLFAAGVLATFLALAGAMIALTQAGQMVGWGFQLQEPWFVAALALLFFVIGLNLLGVFEIGAGVQNVGAGLANRQGALGAFFTGALAVVAATPCTAPFMAGAMGFAATQGPVENLAIFTSLGLGFAAPMLALAFAPGLQKALPKPGPWMVKLKELMAFPMFATAVWLASVLAAQAGGEGVLWLLAGASAIAFLIWALKAYSKPTSRVIAAGALALTLAATYAMTRPSTLPVEPWSPARVAELQAEGKPIFVNFTADWCVTCKVNERSSLSSPEVAAAFARAGVVYLQGDWTARDSVIAAELAAHGRNGVPLYLVYPRGGGAPTALPQILTPQIVKEALAKAAAPQGASS
jgi:thiol:disulfide interchange protein DsbD